MIEELGCCRDFPRPKLTDLCSCMCAVDYDILYRYRLMTRHQIFGEKTKHFSYPDNFTYPVCSIKAVAKGVQIIEVALYSS